MIIVGDNHFCDGGEDLGGGECVGKKLLDMELGHHRYLMTLLGILLWNTMVILQANDMKLGPL